MKKIEVNKNKGIPVDDLGMFLRNKYNKFTDNIEKTQYIYNKLINESSKRWDYLLKKYAK